MHVRVLGTLEVLVDGEVVPLSGQRQRALLAALVLDRGRAVSVDRLVDVVWDGMPPATARTKVQGYVSALRQAIGQPTGACGPLLTMPPGYLLRPQRVDLAEFESLVKRGDQAWADGDPASASAWLANALELWRGSAFADVKAPLVQVAATALGERRLLALETKICSDLALGRCAVVVAELAPWIAAHPFRERLWAFRMIALYRLGCRAEALAVYQRGRGVLVAELGLEPGPQLRRLHQRILADDPALHTSGLVA
jgi:DNA-binding SARP family transcriptional activator